MRYRIALALLLTFALCPRPAAAQANANAGFEKMRTLVGDWEGKTESGKAVRVSYKLVSNGTALLETLSPPGESEMVTVYHPDGSSVGMTHYCSGNNQPQMRTAPVTASVSQLAFNFVRATNLAGPTAGHMHNLVVTFQDQDHFTQKWTWHENGKAMNEVFQFTRKS